MKNVKIIIQMVIVFECNNGYYLMNKECMKFLDKCLTYLDNSTCTLCWYNNVFSKNECVDLKMIDNCITSLKGRCIECTSFHQPNQDGTKYENKNELLLILLIIGVVIAVISIIIIIGILLVSKLRK